MTLETALVVATYSRRMGLRLPEGEEVVARIKGKRLRPVCGDRVEAERIPNETDWLITRVLDRSNELRRPNLRGKIEVLAANIDKLLVMAAGTPQPDWAIVDRYLCAAELMCVAAAVVYNKSDLPAAPSLDEVLADYTRIGYATVRCSAKTGDNLDSVRSILSDGVSIIVGQSGVGKSSLINLLLDDKQLRTASISAKSGEGRHTTVNSALLQLPDGGAVIDSPGVRDYAPALRPEDVAAGFREISKMAQNCRFANCHHLREPGCAVKQAVDDDTISKRRYDSYRHLLALARKLDARRYEGLRS
jgi:ribosome biogenesis GTPase